MTQKKSARSATRKSVSVSVSSLEDQLRTVQKQLSKARHSAATNARDLERERDKRQTLLTKLYYEETKRDLWETAYKQVLASKSWRITAPLRAMKRRMTERQISRQHLKTKSLQFESRPMTEARPDLSFSPSRPLRLEVIAMVRNEMAILPEWLSHCAALFDRIHVVDHISDDGTREYLSDLAAEERFSVYTFDEPGYFQSEVMTEVARRCIGEQQADWVFFLDADEFLPFRSRKEFQDALQAYELVPVISMPWINLIPAEVESDRLLDRTYLRPPFNSPFNKIAFQPRLLPVKDIIVAQGNHALMMAGGGSHPMPVRNAFALYHVPIRTLDQLERKIRQGVKSYENMGDARMPGLGSHWYDMLTMIEAEGPSQEMLAAFASRYSEPLRPPYRISRHELLRNGYQVSELDVARVATLVTPEQQVNVAAAGNRASRTVALNLDLASRKLLARAEKVGTKRKGRSSMNKADGSMLDFLSAASMPIANLTATLWGGHIPFLFCLVRCLRPLVYVELGAQHGASFLAACQTIKEFDIRCAAHAIDLWEGDDSTGKYDERVYATLKWTIEQKYPDIARLNRSSFDAAAEEFKDKSIDLLNIGGIHTYDSIRSIFDTWLPKIKKDGVIVMYGTTGRRVDFGGWQLWNEVKDNYTSFNFEHTHGMGVISLNPKAKSAINSVLSHANASPQSARQFDEFFARAGELSIKAALSQIKLAEIDRIRAAEAQQIKAAEMEQARLAEARQRSGPAGERPANPMRAYAGKLRRYLVGG